MENIYQTPKIEMLTAQAEDIISTSGIDLPDIDLQEI